MLLNCGVGEDSWESLNCKEIKLVNPKGNQPWIFIAGNDAEAPVLWPPDAKNWLLGKDPDSGEDWRQEDKGMTRWDGWMASPTRWTWVWASSGSCWWTGKPGVLQPMGLQSWTRLSDWTDLLLLTFAWITVSGFTSGRAQTKIILKLWDWMMSPNKSV